MNLARWRERAFHNDIGYYRMVLYKSPYRPTYVHTYTFTVHIVWYIHTHNVYIIFGYCSRSNIVKLEIVISTINLEFLDLTLTESCAAEIIYSRFSFYINIRNPLAQSVYFIVGLTRMVFLDFVLMILKSQKQKAMSVSFNLTVSVGNSAFPRILGQAVVLHHPPPRKPP